MKQILKGTVRGTSWTSKIYALESFLPLFHFRNHDLYKIPICTGFSENTTEQLILEGVIFELRPKECFQKSSDGWVEGFLGRSESKSLLLSHREGCKMEKNLAW